MFVWMFQVKSYSLELKKIKHESKEQKGEKSGKHQNLSHRVARQDPPCDTVGQNQVSVWDGQASVQGRVVIGWPCGTVHVTVLHGGTGLEIRIFWF